MIIFKSYLRELQNSAKENPKATIDDFLADVSLITGLDRFSDVENSVTLMTIHASKGLEFPVVFITGCEEDIFPLNQKFDSNSKIEEERRLFYVAITRAEKKVFISYARSRYRFGEVAYQSKSRFLEEFDPSTFNELNKGTQRKGGRRRKAFYDEMYQEDYDDFNQERRSFRVGSRITHELFGNGKVLKIAGAGDMQKVTIAFEEKGTKTLLLKFANIRLAS